ncbi:hypothetical protein, partial [Xanthomonas cissicola]|uniref:hypothetical protein n=1 Tax=Xanthomonas cissicola TaxID=86186 RepID=UPI001C0B4969
VRLFACLVAGGAGAFLNVLKHYAARKHGNGGLTGVFQGRLCIQRAIGVITLWQQSIGQPVK